MNCQVFKRTRSEVASFNVLNEIDLNGIKINQNQLENIFTDVGSDTILLCSVQENKCVKVSNTGWLKNAHKIW